MTIFFGLLSAIVWGGGDFWGGLASRRVESWRAVFYAEIIGLALPRWLTYLSLEFILVHFGSFWFVLKAKKYGLPGAKNPKTVHRFHGFGGFTRIFLKKSVRFRVIRVQKVLIVND